MAAFELHRPVMHGGRTQNLVARLVSRLIAWNDTRVTRKALSVLSDRELADIGLSRADIDTLTY